MSGLLKLALDWRTWLAVVALGLAVALAVTSAQRDAQTTKAEAAVATADRLGRDLRTAEAQRRAALSAKAKAETALTDYAATSVITFQKQAEESARMSAQLAELNRRVRAAQQEIARADGSLRLDDPLPRGVRDGLACAGGDDRACAAATAPAAGRVPGGAADRPASARPGS